MNNDLPVERKIIAMLAVSADGYIARKDGSVDWLDRPSPKGNYGMNAFWKTIDTILWGRKTWDQGIEMGMKDGGFGPKVKHYVFTRRPQPSANERIEFVHEPVGPFVKRLRRQPGKHIWMMGGGGLIASFLDVGALDEFMIHVIPVLIGEGIPLVAPARRTVELKLVSAHNYPDGVVHLHYRVTQSRNLRRIKHRKLIKGRKMARSVRT